MTDKLTEKVARALLVHSGERPYSRVIVDRQLLDRWTLWTTTAEAAITATGVKELLEAAKEIAGQFPNRRTITETMKDDLIAAIAKVSE